jgi:HEAT repeat protein
METKPEPFAPARLSVLQARGEKCSTEGDEAEIIVALHKDVSPNVRHEAAFILGNLRGQSRLINTDAALGALIAATKDPSILVRHEAALALAEFKCEPSINALVGLCRDQQADVVESARHALVEMISPIEPL